MELDRHLEELPWRVNSVDVMVTDVVDAFRKWPWSQYDGVADENPNRVTILDLAVGNVLGAGISMGPRKDDWSGLKDHRRAIDEFLRRCRPAMTLWDTRSEATELLDAFVRLINSLEWVTGWKSGKLTAVLHRKRPRFVPILDSVVVDVLAPHDGVVHRQDRLDRACTALGALRQELLERREKLEQVVQGVARQRPELGRISLVRVADVLMRVRDGEPVSWIWEGAGWR